MGCNDNLAGMVEKVAIKEFGDDIKSYCIFYDKDCNYEGHPGQVFATPETTKYYWHRLRKDEAKRIRSARCDVITPKQD